jgi:hypothetical protein
MDLFDEPKIHRDSPGLHKALDRVRELAEQLANAAVNEPAEAVVAIADELHAAGGQVCFYTGLLDDKPGGSRQLE